MTRARQLTLAYAAGRTAFGLALLGPPSWAAERWIGPDARRRPVRVAMRGLAARDLLLALGTADAVRRGGSVRSWLAATVAGDLADTAASLAARDYLPQRSRWGTPALAGTSAAVGIALALADAG